MFNTLFGCIIFTVCDFPRTLTTKYAKMPGICGPQIRCLVVIFQSNWFRMVSGRRYPFQLHPFSGQPVFACVRCGLSFLRVITMFLQPFIQTNCIFGWLQSQYHFERINWVVNSIQYVTRNISNMSDAADKSINNRPNMKQLNRCPKSCVPSVRSTRTMWTNKSQPPTAMTTAARLHWTRDKIRARNRNARVSSKFPNISTRYFAAYQKQ